jgi:hypothetical protein
MDFDGFSKENNEKSGSTCGPHVVPIRACRGAGTGAAAALLGVAAGAGDAATGAAGAGAGAGSAGAAFGDGRIWTS